MAGIATPWTTSHTWPRTGQVTEASDWSTMTILTSDWLTGGRACYVLECTGGLAQDVITTIGQAFELRFKEFLKKSSGVKERPPPLTSLGPRPDDPEYYNDLPDKAAPGPMGHGGQVSGSSNLIDLSTEIGVDSFLEL